MSYFFCSLVGWLLIPNNEKIEPRINPGSFEISNINPTNPIGIKFIGNSSLSL